MLIKQMQINERYPNKIQSIKGKGFFDSLISAVTSNAAKKMAVNLSKTAVTKLREKAIEKATNKIFEKKK